jgi:hypothetical protein
MNFEQFLKQERTLAVLPTAPKETQEKTKKNKKDEVKIKEEDVKKGKNRQKRFFEIGDKNVKEQTCFNPNEFLFKKGDFVKIIRIPRKEGEIHTRRCDIYMGYFGEIKEIKKGVNTAVVRMEAMNNYHSVEVPIECLIRRDD